MRDLKHRILRDHEHESFYRHTCHRGYSVQSTIIKSTAQRYISLCLYVHATCGLKSELNQLNSLRHVTYSLVIGNYCGYCVTNERFKTMNVTPLSSTPRLHATNLPALDEPRWCVLLLLLCPWNNEKRILAHSETKI